MANPPATVLIIVMGVSGCGKSTLTTNIGNYFHIPERDGDALHTQANRDKMGMGIPLTDADREPWLRLIRRTAVHECDVQLSDENWKGKLTGIAIACSALKRYYRDILRGKHPLADEPPSPSLIPQDMPVSHDNQTNGENTKEDTTAIQESLAKPSETSKSLRTIFVFIKGPREELQRRMAERQGHYMKVGMLDSQLATLESPEGEEDVVVVDLLKSPEEQLEMAVEGLKRLGVSAE
ncbi:hypothetical protein FRC02_005171 [Tulasnella sp. 418]|nr:hypothetical protein FRC02_005171 [Tulasnella sp. 418]